MTGANWTSIILLAVAAVDGFTGRWTHMTGWLIVAAIFLLRPAPKR